jgi:hypothetical protein
MGWWDGGMKRVARRDQMPKSSTYMGEAQVRRPREIRSRKTGPAGCRH